MASRNTIRRRYYRHLKRIANAVTRLRKSTTDVFVVAALAMEKAFATITSESIARVDVVTKANVAIKFVDGINAKMIYKTRKRTKDEMTIIRNNALKAFMIFRNECNRLLAGPNNFSSPTELINRIIIYANAIDEYPIWDGYKEITNNIPIRGGDSALSAAELSIYQACGLLFDRTLDDWLNLSKNALIYYVQTYYPECNMAHIDSLNIYNGYWYRILNERVVHFYPKWKDPMSAIVIAINKPEYGIALDD
jgi:hypothetical protein